MTTVHDETVQKFDAIKNEIIRLLKEFDRELLSEDEAFSNTVLEDVRRYQETSALEATFKSKSNSTNSTDTSKKLETILESDSSKENEFVNVKMSTRSTRTSKKPPLEEIAVTNNTKSINETFIVPSVKMERITEKCSDTSTTSQNSNKEIQVKMEMPPPSKPPIKQSRRRKPNTSNAKTSVQIKAELINETSSRSSSKEKKTLSTLTTATADSINHRDSDVKIHSDHVEVINLNDSDEVVDKVRKTRARTKKQKSETKELSEDSSIKSLDTSKAQPPEIGRVTRTKTKKILESHESTHNDDNSTDNQKREHHSESETESDKPLAKKSKIMDAESSEASEYEDALFTNEAPPTVEDNNVNAVTIVNGDANTIETNKNGNDDVNNRTVVIQKTGDANNLPIGNDLITDDEDEIDKPVLEKRVRKVKKIFSPLSKSPVKKYIAAFEKLNTDSKNNIPIKVTRAKAKFVAQEQNKNSLKERKDATNALFSMKLKENSKVVTPTTNSRVLQASSASKMPISTNGSSQSNSLKSQSEHEMQLRQKKIELIRKKESQAEETRRKREERQLKMQQTRDAMLKEKQKMAEIAERAKLEKQRQIMAENQEKRLKQEALNKMGAIKKTVTGKVVKNNNVVPAYLKYNTPLLPTDDCYDSDDKNKNTFEPPTWQTKPYLAVHLQCMQFAKRYKTVFFGSQPQTPNLQRIFPSIESYKLKRTSSAVWNRSGLVKVEEMVEEEEQDS